MDPIRVGTVPRGIGTPGGYVTIERDGAAFARVDAWPRLAGPFTQTEVWKDYVVLGWNDHVHFVDPLTRDVIAIQCDGYFAHLYPGDGRLLIADASRLICINERGEKLWESGRLGIDGVVVDAVQNGVIEGQGEWDPPGGWKSFQLSLATGERLR